MFGEHTRCDRELDATRPAGTGGPRATTATRSAPRSSRSIPRRSCPTAAPTTRARRTSSLAVSSLHPGGANVALCDGSVRFVKETISSWQNTPTSPGAPPGMVVTPVTDPSCPGYRLRLDPDPQCGEVRRLAAARHPQWRRSRQLRLLLILERPEDSWAASRSRRPGRRFRLRFVPHVGPADARKRERSLGFVGSRSTSEDPGDLLRDRVRAGGLRHVPPSPAQRQRRVPPPAGR